jgi:hypothetical protein
MHRTRPNDEWSLSKYLMNLWQLTKLGLKRIAAGGLVLESARWVLRGRFPELLRGNAPGLPEWIRIFWAADLALFLSASLLALCHIICAIAGRNWKYLNPIGILLCIALWIEAGFVTGRFHILGH